MKLRSRHIQFQLRPNKAASSFTFLQNCEKLFSIKGGQLAKGQCPIISPTLKTFYVKTLKSYKLPRFVKISLHKGPAAFPRCDDQELLMVTPPPSFIAFTPIIK